MLCASQAVHRNCPKKNFCMKWNLTLFLPDSPPLIPQRSDSTFPLLPNFLTPGCSAKRSESKLAAGKRVAVNRGLLSHQHCPSILRPFIFCSPSTKSTHSSQELPLKHTWWWQVRSLLHLFYSWPLRSLPKPVIGYWGRFLSLFPRGQSARGRYWWR